MVAIGGKKILGMDQNEFSIFSRRYGIGVVMVAMIILLAIISPTFRTSGNIISIMLQVSMPNRKTRNLAISCLFRMQKAIDKLRGSV